MAGELQASFAPGRTCYFLVRSSTALIYSAQFGGFSGYVSALYSGYAISAVQQGNTGYYVGNFPSVAPGYYNAVMAQAISGVPLETDTVIDVGSVEWNGSGVAPRSNIAASGVQGTIELRRGWAVPNYPIYLRSSADHVTPFVSGIISGVISQNGGNAIPLQSGSFTPVVGIPGAYVLQALTSGDLTCDTATLLFTAVGISGGTSDPLVQSFILQQSSG